MQYANLIQLSEVANRRFLKQVYDPFRLDFACLCNPHCCGEVVGWSSVEGGQSFLRSDYNAKGLKDYDVDVTLGAHTFLSSCFALGIAGNYQYDHVNFYQSGTGNGNTFQGGLYGMYEASCAYVFGEIMGGYTHWDIKRIINFDSYFELARGKPQISHAAAYGEGGLNLWWRTVLIQPFLGLEYGHYWRTHASESGAAAANLFVHAQDFDNFESRLGAHFTSSCGRFLFSADADWRYRYTHLGDTLSLSFIDFGPSFSIIGPRQNRNSFEGAVYGATPLCDTVTAYVEGFGEVSNRFANYGVTLGLQKVW